MKKDAKPFISAALGAGVVAGAVFLSRKRKTAEVPPLQTPAPVINLEAELKTRMGEFLEQDRFSLVIQPVVDFRDNTVVSGESLSRLEHPELGVIFPDEYLPIVDALGLYPRFDRYIFRKSCAWMSSALADGEKLHYLSCNFSRKTLSEASIVEDLIRIAGRYDVPRSALALEITERERETDVPQLIENLNRLKSAGFRILLDDFGNGVTSLNDLMQYPLDIVKIDRSLLLRAEAGQGVANFRALISTAIGLGAEVVCEGIETQDQDHFAREAGCHYGQGYLYFKPIHHSRFFEAMTGCPVLDKRA